MDGFDTTTWQALGLVLTLLGLGLSAAVWARRGPGKGLRAVAWSLLPLAAGLTGVLRLVWDITDSVLRWGAGLAFSPLVWLGLVVAAVSVVLFVVSGWMMRRNGAAAKRPAQVAPAGAAALPRSAANPPAQAPGSAGQGGSRPEGAGDDMADIEEILRKHGIQ